MSTNETYSLVASLCSQLSLCLKGGLCCAISVPTVYEDNDGAMRLAMSGLGQKRARHISVKRHYVQDLCTEGKLTVERVLTREQTADFVDEGLPYQEGPRTPPGETRYGDLQSNHLSISPLCRRRLYDDLLLG